MKKGSEGGGNMTEQGKKLLLIVVDIVCVFVGKFCSPCSCWGQYGWKCNHCHTVAAEKTLKYSVRPALYQESCSQWRTGLLNRHNLDLWIVTDNTHVWLFETLKDYNDLWSRSTYLHIWYVNICFNSEANILQVVLILLKQNRLFLNPEWDCLITETLGWLLHWSNQREDRGLDVLVYLSSLLLFWNVCVCVC